VKRVLVRLALVLGLLVGVAPPPVVSFAAAQSKQDPQAITVYVTRTGQKYHREWCRQGRETEICCRELLLAS